MMRREMVAWSTRKHVANAAQTLGLGLAVLPLLLVLIAAASLLGLR